MRGVVGAWLVLFAGSVRAEDFNRTLIHYFLTSGQNVRLEIERTRGVVAAMLLEEWLSALDAARESPSAAESPPSGSPAPPDVSAQVPPLSVSDRHTAFFRCDYLIPKKSDQYTFLFGTLAYGSRDFRPTDDLRLAFYGGFTIFDVRERRSEDDFESIATFWNFLAGIEGRWRDILGVDANVSVNGLSVKREEKTLKDFDQAGFRLCLPFLGPYGTLTYDLGDARPRDVEVGWTYVPSGAGILTLAYGARFSYPVTGIAVRDDLPPEDRFDIPGDHSGLVRWERIAPLGRVLELHGGVALGNVPGVVRHAWGGITVWVLGRLGVFGRGGTAWSRLDRRRFEGGSGGAEVGWTPVPVSASVNGRQTTVPVTLSLRVGAGYRDPDIIDRLGDVGRATLSGTFYLTF